MICILYGVPCEMDFSHHKSPNPARVACDEGGIVVGLRTLLLMEMVFTLGHFMFEVVFRLLFSEESEGADHCLKKGAQHAHFGPFLAHEWAKLKRLCCLT